MRQSVSLVTLGVSDYGKAKAFYEALGWWVTWEAEETSFFQANGVVLVLWSREKLAAEMGIRDGATAARSRESRPRRSTAGMPARSATSTGTPGRSRTTPASASRPTGA
jgi:catechol-2,3-dioxygenase